MTYAEFHEFVEGVCAEFADENGLIYCSKCHNFQKCLSKNITYPDRSLEFCMDFLPDFECTEVF